MIEQLSSQIEIKGHHRAATPGKTNKGFEPGWCKVAIHVPAPSTEASIIETLTRGITFPGAQSDLRLFTW